MKKKLSCFLVAVAMLAGMTACGDGSATNDLSENAKYNMTLTLWLPTSEDTTDAAVAQVEAAINKITKKNYKTAIDIHAIPDDKYDEAIHQRVLEVEQAEKLSAEEEAARKKAEKEALKRGETIAAKTTEATTVADTVIGDNGEVEEVYPAATANQLDIFCIRGYDEFAFYTENGYLSPIDEYLSASSKLIKSYVYPTFLDWGKIPGDSTTFAVPNNHVIGDYTYLLINKELCDSLYFDPSELTTLLDCQPFIEAVGASSNVTPMLSSAWASGIRFWNSSNDTESFSLIASLVSDENDPTSRHALRNVLGLKQFNKTVVMMKELQEKGYIAADPSAVTEFGVGIVTCDGSEVGKYADDYYINVIERPRAETADVYQSMFGVSMYSLDVGRSMEIITLINTDPTVRTLLQYGVEGKHWEYNTELTESGEQTIKIISNDYKMNLVDTGNVFITYPGENLPMSYWEAGKQQNLDSLISPYLGFTDYLNDDNKDMVAALDAYSASIWARIEAMSAAEYDESVKDLKDEVDNNIVYAEAADAENVDTVIARYLAFYQDVHQGQPVS